MNKKTTYAIAAILVIATLILGFQFYKARQADQIERGTTRTVTNDMYGISFAFNEGEDAFTLIEPPEDQAGIHKSYVILPTKAYREYQNSEDIREAPAGMNLFILTLEAEPDEASATTAERADRMTRLKEWAVKHDGLTQYSQKKAEPEEVEIDGLRALKYQADGLYQQTMYLATYKNNVYMFVSQYNEQSDVTYTAFEPLLTSVSFD